MTISWSRTCIIHHTSDLHVALTSAAHLMSEKQYRHIHGRSAVCSSMLEIMEVKPTNTQI